MPKYSIITCTYNSEKYIKKNIESVKNQTFKDFEHIFIDGESTDNTIQIIKKYQDTNPKKIHTFNQTPGGISKAMNEGIKRATGEYLIHLHSDDSFYNKDVLQKVDIFLKKNNDLDRIYGKANVVEEDGITSVGIFPKHRILQQNSKSRGGNRLLKPFNYIPHQAVFIKKSVFKKMGYFDETLKYAMDPDMRLRIKDKTKWTFVDIIIPNYMIREGAQSSGKKNYKKNHKLWKKMTRRHSNIVEYYIILLIHSIIILFNKTKR